MTASHGAAVSAERVAVLGPDGTRLSVVVAEPGRQVDGLPPVLAIHGFGSSAEYTWGVTGHLAALTRAGRRVIAPDLRGHGLSDRPHRPAAYRLDAVLADLSCVAATIAGDAALDVMGYSLGARLAWSLAARAELTVRRLVLGGYDGRLLFEGVDPKLLASLLARPRRADMPGDAGLAAATTGRDGAGLGGRVPGDGGLAAAGVGESGQDSTIERATRRIAGIVDAVRGNDRQALTALVSGLVSTPNADPAPPIPTLVAAGTADPLASRAASLAAVLPAGSYLAIPGRDHVSAVVSKVFRRGAVEFLAVR